MNGFEKKINVFYKKLAIIFAIVCLCGCNSYNQEKKKIFKKMESSHTGIDFENVLNPTKKVNTYSFKNFYNGGGVAIGDINNDGKQDIFLTGNQVSNKLYLNKGGFQFVDITKKAGVGSKGVWSTGVAMVDVNGDGWIDIYVCKSGPPGGEDRHNELFINQGDSTFTDKSKEYGLDITGLSIQASFLDYDRDGDLDMYLLSNPIRSLDDIKPMKGLREMFEPGAGNRLFKSKINSQFANGDTLEFVDVTAEANIYSSKIGFGLGVTVSDVNRDGWSDIYVYNDFFERDYLYINDKNGSFREVLDKYIGSISLSSMGGDIVDINNDGYPEIFGSDMLPGTEYRLKSKSSIDRWSKYRSYVKKSYHHQFTRNVLQLNRGPKPYDNKREYPAIRFSEVGRLAGVEATGWSWGGLIADFDLDGNRDLFVPNGIYKDLLDQDYISKVSNSQRLHSLVEGTKNPILKIIDKIPSNPVPNYMFSGGTGLRFTEVSEKWGLAKPSFSNGAAYGDLDNDGDLDLVVNNVNMKAFVYRNRARELYPDRAWLQVKLEGQPPNTSAIGAQVTAWADGRQWYVEQQPVRGFQSTVGSVLHFGFGRRLPSDRLDSLVVRWPDGSKTVRREVTVNRRLSLQQPRSDAESAGAASSKMKSISSQSPRFPQSYLSSQKNGDRSAGRESRYFEKISPSSLGLDWKHRENRYNDFKRQPLLFHMRSTEGPPVCTGDINDDGTADVFVGGARGQSGSVFLQSPSGSFDSARQPALVEDRKSEDTDCALFDADGDGNLDLYVASGGSEYPASSSNLMDRLYMNDGGGKLIQSDQLLIPASEGFEPTGAVVAADYDGDGDVDLFVGARMRPFAFGIPADGHLLINDGTGSFTERSDALAPGLEELGMITDAEWADIDGDEDLDLMVAGEWMPLTLFENQEGKLVDQTSAMGLKTTSGWWNAIELADLDGDADLDLIGANHGLNSRFEASPERPLRMWVDHFDNDGNVEQIIAIHREGELYPMALRHDLLDAIPNLKDDYPSYKSYAGQTVYQIFTDKQLRSATSHQVQTLQSVVGWNEGGGEFRFQQLPQEAQFAPMYDIHVDTLDSTGNKKIVMGGNLYEAKPQVGRYDASYGVVMAADSSAIKSVPASRSGFWINGQVRDIETLSHNQGRLLVVGVNDDSLRVFRY